VETIQADTATRVTPTRRGVGRVRGTVSGLALTLAVLTVGSVLVAGVAPAAAQAADDATLGPSPVAYGGTAVGTTVARNVTVTNDGNGTLNVTGVAVTGADAGAFAVTPGANGSTLASGESLNATVAYTPTDTGGDNASLNVSFGDGSHAAVSLSGTGTEATLSGTVTDFGAGVENATVAVDGTDTATTTDADGTYAVTVTESSVALTVYHEFVGGTNATVTPTVSVSGDTTRDIAFDQPTPADLPGDGSADDPYEISTVRELRATEDDLDANYTLTADIDASRTVQWRARLTKVGAAGKILYNGFAPIGEYDGSFDPVTFDGTFDGNGHTISNVSTDYGLFAAIGEPGVVRNVHVVDANVTPPKDQIVADFTNLGIIARENSGTIAASHVEGRVVPENGTIKVSPGDERVFRRAGGVAGSNSRLGVIQNVSANVTVTLSSIPVGRLVFITAGGLVADNEGVIRDVAIDANVTSPYGAGGVTAFNDGVIREATVDGEVTTLGYLYDTAAPVDGVVGGVAGAHSDDGVITDVASGTGITRNSTETAGGGVVGNIGDTASINDTYVTGTVSGVASDDGQALAGPVVGRIDNWNGVVRDTYWDEETAGQATANVDGTTNLTTAEMTGPNVTVTMAGLEFFDAWLANETGYPRLAAQVPDEDGTPTAPFEVSNPYDLAAVERNRSAAYRLTDDVDASERPLHTGDGFDPVGNDTVAFTGSFDGETHTVSNLTVDRPNADGVGLFGVVEGGTVRNVTLADATVTGADGTGGLVGRSVGGNVTNVTLEGGTVTGGNRTGGVVGDATGTTVTTAAVEGGTVTGANGTGGVIGRYTRDVPSGYPTGPVTSVSVADGTVEGTTRTGGVVGSLGRVRVRNATVGGVAVSGTGAVGGAVGANDGIVTRSTVDASVDGGDGVGGAAGTNAGSVGKVAVDGSVEGDTAVGGLAGNNTGRVERAYAVAAVSGANAVGGAVGTGDGTVSGVYWDTAATGQTSSAGGSGLTTAEMTDVYAVPNMTALDFETEWALTEGYPVLAERIAGDSPAPFVVTITDTSSPARTGDPLTVDVRVENLGGFVATERLELLAVDGRVVDVWNVTLLGGGSTTATLTWTPSTPTAGPVAVAGPGSDPTANVTVDPAEALFDVALTTVSASVDAGDEIRVEYRVTNAGASAGEGPVRFTVDGRTVNVTNLTLFAGERATGAFTYRARAADAPNVTVGLETSLAGGSDAATATVSVGRFGDPLGVGNVSAPPADLDGDGRYADVDGDGSVTYADVVVLFENFDSPTVRSAPTAFDFDDDGRLSYVDIITLFDRL
jgi:hypothetical protein